MSAQPIPVAERESVGLRSHALRQINHWEGAAERLDDFEATATPEAWASLERYVGVTLRAGLKAARDQLKREAIAVRASFNAARSRYDLERLADHISLFRRRYLQTELLSISTLPRSGRAATPSLASSFAPVTSWPIARCGACWNNSG